MFTQSLCLQYVFSLCILCHDFCQIKENIILKIKCINNIKYIFLSGNTNECSHFFLQYEKKILHYKKILASCNSLVVGGVD